MDDDKKLSLLQLVAEYLNRTRPLIMMFHLFYLSGLALVFAVAYVIAFHWTSLVTLYEEAHSVSTFSTNLKINVEHDNEIGMALSKVLEETHGMRAYIYRYHNGLAAISGVPFFFQTMTHEIISQGAARIIRFEQRIPVGIHLAVNNQFINNKCAIIIKTDADINSQDYLFYQNHAAKAVIQCPIYMPNGDLFGYVGVDYPKELDKTGDDAVQVKTATDHIASLFASMH
jgi:hypothetical protein